MKGYTTQYADYNLILDTNGSKVDTDKLLEDHANSEAIHALIGHKYRPENLHNNGDIDDSYNPEALHLARVTHERKNVNKSDLCEQASFERSQWQHLAATYQSYVKKTQRWIHGYNPEAIKPDAKFMRKVNEAKLKMRKSRSYAASMRKAYADM